MSNEESLDRHFRKKRTCLSMREHLESVQFIFLSASSLPEHSCCYLSIKQACSNEVSPHQILLLLAITLPEVNTIVMHKFFEYFLILQPKHKYAVDTQKNHLIEMVLLSINNMFWFTTFVLAKEEK